MTGAEPTSKMTGRVGWWLVIGIVLLEYALFRQYALREVTWAYPTNYDQVQYLAQSYDTYEQVLRGGPSRGLLQGLRLAPPQGLLIHLQAAIVFLLIGASRLSALTLNFLYWAAFQLCLVATLRWLTRGWSIPLLGLGLLLSAAAPFFWVGGLMDFRLDFAALCAMGILACVVMRSGVFESPTWSAAAGVAAALCVLLRFITLAYLLVTLAVLIAYFAWSRKSRPQDVRHADRLRGVAIAIVVAAALAGPGLWFSRNSIRVYYAGAQMEEAQIRARQMGLSSRWLAAGFYPRSIVADHAGPVFFGLAGIVLATLTLVRLRSPRLDAAAALPLDLPSAGVFVAASIVGPLVVLTPNTAKSPVVASIVVPALVWLVVLLVIALGWNRSPAGRALPALALISILTGLYTQFDELGRRGALTTRRSDVEQLLQLADTIANFSLRTGWNSPVISVDTVSDHINGGIVAPLAFERHGLLLRPRTALGGRLLDVGFAEAKSMVNASDFVIVTGGGTESTSETPFERSLRELRPRLRELCERKLVRLGEFRIDGRTVQLYVRPAVAVEGDSGGWLTSDGVIVTGMAEVLRARPVIVLQGELPPPQWIGDSLPGVVAEMNTPHGAPVRIPVKLSAGGPHYRLVASVDPTGIKDGDLVRIRITFDRFFVPRDLGINGDTRRLVIPTPQQVDLLAVGAQVDDDSVPQPDRARLQRGS